MIDRAALLSDLKELVTSLEDDLRDHLAATPSEQRKMADDYAAAKAAGRTAQTENAFRDDQLTQAAVAWVLAAVFIRFLEDNDLVASTPELSWPRLSGANSPSDRLRRARDAQNAYFAKFPSETDREYLLATFRAVARLPGMGPLFLESESGAVNPLFRFVPSADGATAILDFFRRIDPDTGALIRDFTDPERRTRFLGDLYQDLSAAVRDKYALLQTPDFVLEFLLDRTLEPAIEEFGLAATTLIDPTCGSGHFLLAAFERLLAKWQRAEPATNVRELTQRALRQVAGVDINPFAIAIARFRLLVAALQACAIRRLIDAPDFRFELAVGDSLLFGKRPRHGAGVQRGLYDDGLNHHYASEDVVGARRILERTYAVVVGNPPYIVVRDAALNEAYRDRFPSCHRQYSLVTPFIERFFDLAFHADSPQERAGYVAMIAANSFMKREFGTKVIEDYLRRHDLTCVVDTSGAYIPGHGTPTVLLFARGRWPVAKYVRAVQGIRGEPGTPEDPATGKVWTEIRDHVDEPGFEGMFVSVVNVERGRFDSHPWSTGGGGASELRALLEEESDTAPLLEFIDEVGFCAVTREDDVYEIDFATARRHRIRKEHIKRFVAGEEVRDWTIFAGSAALFPYEPCQLDASADPRVIAYLWPYRTGLSERVAYGFTQLERGLRWFEYSMLFKHRYCSAYIITFAEVATHNHFVLDRGGKVFKQTAPVIKLPAGASEEDHLGLLGILNSSTACFWLRQVCTPKGGDHVGQEGARVTKTLWEERFAFNASNVANFPLPQDRTVARARHLDEVSQRCSKALRSCEESVPSQATIRTAKTTAVRALAAMIAEQEELDWECYRLYELTDEDLFLPPGEAPPLNLGERAFEIVLARKLAAGEVETKWFERHGSTPITEIPSHWPEPYRQLVSRRIEMIASNANVRLIEQPEYKRRWNQESWEEQQKRALRSWLLDRLEDPKLWPRGGSAGSSASLPLLRSTSQLADLVRSDRDFLQVAELYAGRPDFDLSAIVRDLVESDAVPYLPILRYKPSGLRKREDWEKTWELQRKEDAIDALGLDAAESKARKKSEIGDIPVPPKYASSDFLKPTYWRLRGKLDVPKERFVSYPFASRDTDPSPVVTWAGYDQLEQAKALATFYVARKNDDGWSNDRLQPLLLGLLELLPWIRQWHPELDAELGTTMGDYFQGFIDEEARHLGLTLAEIRKWMPPETPRRGRKKNG